MLLRACLYSKILLAYKFQLRDSVMVSILFSVFTVNKLIRNVSKKKEAFNKHQRVTRLANSSQSRVNSP